MSDIELRLEELRRRLETARQFSDVFDYFESELTLSDEFIAACKPQANAKVTSLVEAAVAQVLGQKTRLSHVLCRRYPNTDFFHGAGFAPGGGTTMFLWFDTTKQGLAVYGPSSGPTRFMRLTETPLPASTVPMRRPGGRPS